VHQLDGATEVAVGQPSPVMVSSSPDALAASTTTTVES